MYAVSPAANGGAGAASIPRPAATVSRTPMDLAASVGRAPAGSPIQPGAVHGAGVNGIQNAVGQMLRGLGGELANDKLLQMMIALLILLTMLEEMNGGSANRGGGQQLPGAQSGGQGSYVMMAATSTTISIEQTSVYMVAGTGPAMFTDQAGSSPSGGQLDVSA